MAGNTEVSVSMLSGLAIMVVFWGLCWGEPDVIDAWGAKLSGLSLGEYMAMRADE